jgi:hypothetical protein
MGAGVSCKADHLKRAPAWASFSSRTWARSCAGARRMIPSWSSCLSRHSPSRDMSGGIESRLHCPTASPSKFALWGAGGEGAVVSTRMLPRPIGEQAIERSHMKRGWQGGLAGGDAGSSIRRFARAVRGRAYKCSHSCLTRAEPRPGFACICSACRRATWCTGRPPSRARRRSAE